MKKPELNDYNLTQGDFTKLEKQKENYDNSFRKLSAEYDEYNKRINWLAAIPSIIVAIPMMILWYKLNNLHEGSEITVILLLAFVIVYPILICKFCKKDCLSDSRCDKYLYVDKNLENRINQYNKAIDEYDEYCRKLKVSFWQNLSGYEFEKEVANLYKKLGYSTYVTKATGDGGVDIVLKKDDKVIAVQCKHHSSKVGPNDVRALIGVIASNNKYDSGIFVSLNGFTPTVSEELKNSRIKIDLVTLSDLLEMAK